MISPLSVNTGERERPEYGGLMTSDNRTNNKKG